MTNILDLSEFERLTSLKDKIGSGTRHASYFIVVNEGAMNGKTPDEYFAWVPKHLQDNLSIEFLAYNMEKNKQGKMHIHIYVELSNNGVRFSRIQKLLPGAHIELRRGSPKQALLYLQKPAGVQFSGQEKSHTVVIPVVTVGDFTPYECIKYRRKSPLAVMSTQEKFDYFVENYNSYDEVKYVDVHFATMHKDALMAAFNEKMMASFVKSTAVKTYRNGDGGVCYSVDRAVYYLYGYSRTGKTFGVSLKHGDKNVSRLTNLRANMKYDDYNCTPVMILDEFYSQLSISEALNVLDDKISQLPCRYQNKPNLTSTIVLTSNSAISKQYPDEEFYRRCAFLNRFTAGVWFMYRAAATPEEINLPPELHTGARYICCEYDGKRRYYLEPDFSPCEPPIHVDGVNVKCVSYEDMQRIMRNDKVVPFS